MTSAAAYPGQFGGGQRINLCDVYQCSNANFFAFFVARAAGGAVIHSLDSVATEDTGIGAPGDDFPLRRFAGDALVISIDGANHLVLFADARAGDRDTGFEFQTPVRVRFLK